MPRPVGYGRPGTRVFPAGWDTVAGRVLDDTFDSTVQIGPAGGTRTWSDADRQTVTAPAAAVYSGAASVRPASDNDSDAERVVGEDAVTVARYQVTLPRPTSGIAAGHLVTVAASPDVGLVNRTLTVVGVEYGDRRFTRIVYATLNS